MSSTVWLQFSCRIHSRASSSLATAPLPLKLFHSVDETSTSPGEVCSDFWWVTRARARDSAKSRRPFSAKTDSCLREPPHRPGRRPSPEPGPPKTCSVGLLRPPEGPVRPRPSPERARGLGVLELWPKISLNCGALARVSEPVALRRGAGRDDFSASGGTRIAF